MVRPRFPPVLVVYSQAAQQWGSSGTVCEPPDVSRRRGQRGSAPDGPRGYGCRTMTPKQVAPPPYGTAAVRVLRLPGGEARDDRLAVEEPLELRIGGTPVAVTMRTPGHDEELALGFALSEGLRPVAARFPDDLAANTIELEAPGFDPGRLARSFYTTSSCGVCGKGALEAIAVESPAIESSLTIPAAVVGLLPERLRETQSAFASTGGLHATGLFTADGTLVCAREDVGRHNAMD